MVWRVVWWLFGRRKYAVKGRVWLGVVWKKEKRGFYGVKGLYEQYHKREKKKRR